VELDLVALVVGQRRHPADRVAACIHVQGLNPVRGVAAVLAVVANQHDQDNHGGDDHHAQQPKPGGSRLHRRTSFGLRTLASLPKDGRNARGLAPV
jgi:hypothetical protein